MPGYKRAYCMSVDDRAVQYAKDELGYSDPVIYGSQVDPSVVGVYALWLRERACRKIRVGLIVCADRGVLDEFDPDADKPGTLKQKVEVSR